MSRFSGSREKFNLFPSAQCFLINLIVFLPLPSPISLELGKLAALESLWLNNNQLNGKSVNEFLYESRRCSSRRDKILRRSVVFKKERRVHCFFIPRLICTALLLTGFIPPHLGNLAVLQRLDLDCNGISGES